MKARRYSRQRTLILETLRRNPIHPTADEVYRLVHEEDPHLSLGTVYRNLNLLAEDGVILTLRSDKNCERFDGNPNPHYHFRCEACGRVLDLPLEYQTALDALAAGTGYDISGHETYFRGTCPDCKSMPQT